MFDDVCKNIQTFVVNLRNKVFILSLFLGLYSSFCNAQMLKKGDKKDNLITVGIEFTPIIPTQLFGRNSLEILDMENNIDYNISPIFSTRYGMTVRYDMFQLVNMFSIQTGIYYTNRNYRILIDEIEGGIRKNRINDDFRMIGYEIPVMGLLYIQLSRDIFMNVATGLSVDFFPSHVYSLNEEYRQYTARKSWILPSWKTNLGWEFRTEKSGFFYAGFTYHRPIFGIADTFVNFNLEDKFTIEQEQLSGIYFSLDLKYFFDPYRDKKESQKLKRR